MQEGLSSVSLLAHLEKVQVRCVLLQKVWDEEALSDRHVATERAMIVFWPSSQSDHTAPCKSNVDCLGRIHRHAKPNVATVHAPIAAICTVQCAALPIYTSISER